MRILLLLFVERSYTLWHPAETMVWLQDNAAALLARMRESATERQKAEDLALWRKEQFPRMPLNLQRHVVVSKIEVRAQQEVERSRGRERERRKSRGRRRKRLF